MSIKKIVNDKRQHREYEDSYIQQDVVYNNHIKKLYTVLTPVWKTIPPNGGTG